MRQYILRRILVMIPTLIVISMITFVIINLPPGDYLHSYIARLEQSQREVTQDLVESIRVRYGLDRPIHVRYFMWARGIVSGDFGYSFRYNRPVADLIGERLALTVGIALVTIIFTWVIAFPIGIYSAVRQYSIGDVVATVIGYIGLAIPNFMLALILMYVSFRYFGFNVGGLFSMEYAEAPWSWGKIVDLLQHLWVPVVVVGTAGTAGLIRIMRANMLDELPKQYVMTARAKGLHEWAVIAKYPVRVALNPFISTVGWLLPVLVSGEIITAVVLGLPTTGPLLLEALRSQDMYLAGSFVMFLATLTVIGTFVSDILLALLDPRIRYSVKEG
jgi:peptide/nickel transport system permease protein